MKLPSKGMFIRSLPELQDRERIQKFSSNLGFGIVGTPENIRGQMVSGTTPGVPDTEFTIVHQLNYIPVGFLQFGHDIAGSVYRGTTAWTKTNIYLKCNVATLTYTIFIH